MKMSNVMFAICSASALGAGPGPLKFERTVIDANFPGGYQVEVADVNGDKKPDIVALGGSTLAWYENPTWTKRVVSTSKQTPDIISSATADLDGDGKAEIAIAYDFSMNEPRRGKLLLAIQGSKPGDPWTFTPIVDEKVYSTVENRFPGLGYGIGGAGIPVGASGVKHLERPKPGEVPSIHRLRWGYIFGTPKATSFSVVLLNKKPELIVAPIFGPSATPPAFDQDPAHLFLFDTGNDPKSGRWTSRIIDRAPVLHAIEVVSRDDERPATILAASNLGVTEVRIDAKLGGPMNSDFSRHQLGSGASGAAPKKGASEVHRGRVRDGRSFIATVEPWHGSEVVIYDNGPEPRKVIDSTLKEGHALWVADVDGDGDDEVFAGYRGGEGGVLMFDFDGKSWNKSVLDPAVTAQDLRGGDIDGDGTPDVVAIGGKSHNVVWYRPIRPAR